MDSGNPILDAYNEGLGDGLVAATAIMGNAGNKIVQEIKAEIAKKRRQFKATKHCGYTMTIDSPDERATRRAILEDRDNG